MAQQFKYKYKLTSNVELNPIELELACFRSKRTREEGGLGAYMHFKNVCRMLYPKRIFSEWSYWRFKTATEHWWNSWAGCAACGKTDDAVFYAFIWWLCDPLNSAVIMTSTTGKMIKKRGWATLQRILDEFPGEHGFNLVDSKMTLQAVKGDDKHSISAIAVKEGTVSKAAADIQGHHCPRVMVIVDEAEDTPEAIYEAINNLQAGTKEFLVIEIANPESRFSCFGRHIEPKKGWTSITVEDDEWETSDGICLHFDGEQSPNVKAGETKYDFLINQKQLDVIAKKYGGTQTVGYYKFGRGFPAPDGLIQVVISESALVRSGAFGKHVFVSEKTPIGGLDPAFTSGGDKCKLQFAEMGDLEDGTIGINLTDDLIIPINATDKDPPRYQILKRVRFECEKRGVLPFCFGLDDTSGGVGDILHREWSPKVRRVLFGGSASETEQVSVEDSRPAKEEYDNRVTELWYRIAEFVDAGQLRGLSSDSLAVRQLTSRQWNFKGRKRQIEKKEDYRERSGRSPDDADAVAVVVEVARQLGARPGGARANQVDSDWEERCQAVNEAYSNADYSEAA